MELTESPGSRPGEGQPRTLRLTFAYEGNRVRIVSRQRVDMRAVPSDPVYDYEGQSGCWFELRDAGDRVLYRRVIRHPMPGDIEAPSGDPARTFTRVKVADPRGSFVLTMPDLGRAQTLVLWASPVEEPGRPARAIERFDLRATDPKGTE